MTTWFGSGVHRGPGPPAERGADAPTTRAVVAPDAPATVENTRRDGAGRRLIAPAALTAAVLVLLLVTLNDHGFAWDEAFTVERVDRLREWFAWLGGDTSPATRAWAPTSSNLEPRPSSLRGFGRRTGSPWDRDALRFFWPFAREEPNGHPPFYALLGLAGLSVSRGILAPPACYRLGPVVLFAATVGAVYGFIAPRHGRAAGAMAALGLLTMPRVFAHAHFASYDAPTLCLWFLAVAAFHRACLAQSRSVLWSVAFGVAWGCAAATKLTGWFVPVPLLAWALLYRDRRGARVLLIGGAVAAVVLYALTPPWWTEPLEGVRVFLRSNLGREARSPIPTCFFGRVYPYALPWYNTLVWTAIVVPPATLVLALLGVGRIVAGRLRDRSGTLLLMCWAFFMVLRALPAAPGHDGARQFLPAFVFLACLTGTGVDAVRALAARVLPPRTAGRAVALITAVAVGLGAWSTWRFHPIQLSYYNALIGGAAGAARAGMEPTYYWDALTPAMRDWLNRHTGSERSVLFIYPLLPFEYLHHWGLLRPPPVPDRAHPPQWLVIQNRPGTLRTYPPLKLGAHLLAHARPAHANAAPGAPEVPLVAVYSIEDAAEAERRMERDAPAR